jgi:ATP-binding cassette subfamily F protein 3
VVVAHDRYFLDRLTNRTWDLHFGRLETYRGNYSHFLRQKAEREERRQLEWSAQQAAIKRTQDYIQRYKAGQRSKQAIGRQRRLDRLERLERPREAQNLSLHLQAGRRTGDVVLEIESLDVGYYDEPTSTSHHLLHVPEVRVFRGEQVALMGPNGSGKSSLIRTLLDENPPLGGAFRLGAGVMVGYMPQGHADLDPNLTVLDCLLEVRNLPLSEARDFLGRFLFSGDDVYKQVGDLSGGEQSRVALARLALQGANFLILDEPTTHLDIASREILEEVLAGFEGTILFVSHDRYFVDRLADRVWWLGDGALHAFRGTYREFVSARQEAREAAAQAREKAAAPDRAEVREQRRRRANLVRQQQQAEELEHQIADLEARLERLDDQLAQASLNGEADRIQDLARERQDMEDSLEQAMQAWTEVAELVTSGAGHE